MGEGRWSLEQINEGRGMSKPNQTVVPARRWCCMDVKVVLRLCCTGSSYKESYNESYYLF